MALSVKVRFIIPQADGLQNGSPSGNPRGSLSDQGAEIQKKNAVRPFTGEVDDLRLNHDSKFNDASTASVMVKTMGAMDHV